MLLPDDSADPALDPRVATDCEDWETTPIIAVLAFFFLPIIGLCLRFVVVLLTDASIENGMPVGKSESPHAWNGIPISMPICLPMGTAIGLAIAFAVVQLRLTAIVILFLATTLGWLISSSAWSQYVATSGRDFAEKMLFYPPIALVVISGLVGGVMAMLLVLGVLNTQERDNIEKLRDNLPRDSLPYDVALFLLISILAILTPTAIVVLCQLGGGTVRFADFVSYQLNYFHYNVLFQIEALLITFGLAFYLLFYSQLRGRRWLTLVVLVMHIPFAFVLVYIRNLGGLHWWN